MAKSRPIVYTLLLMLFLSGIAQPLVLELVKYAGAGNVTSLLYMIPNYIGMIGMLMLPQSTYADSGSTKKDDESTDYTGYTSHSVSAEGAPLVPMPAAQTAADRIKFFFKVGGAATLDFGSYTLCTGGMFLTGSSLYTIIYSAVCVFVALLSRFFLKKKLHQLQWIAVSIVTVGLALSGAQVSSYGSSVTLGCAIVLVGTFGHSCSYVVNEFLMTPKRGKHAPIPAPMLCGYVGCFALFYCIIWQIVWTIPRWSSLVSAPIAEHGHSTVYILTLYLVLLIVDAVHAGVFYFLLGEVGAVTTGVVKGITSVGVFVFSSVFFCHLQSSQCFTLLKGVSFTIVVCGAFAYSYGGALKKKEDAVPKSPTLVSSPTHKPRFRPLTVSRADEARFTDT